MRAVRIRGEGTVDVAAHGLADAEHLLEKEMRALWPGARIVVIRVSRGGEPRIVEEFSLSYRIEASVEAEGEDEAALRRAAFRSARERLAGSRYRNTSWTAIDGGTATP